MAELSKGALGNRGNTKIGRKKMDNLGCLLLSSDICSDSTYS